MLIRLIALTMITPIKRINERSGIVSKPPCSIFDNAMKMRARVNSLFNRMCLQLFNGTDRLILKDSGTV